MKYIVFDLELNSKPFKNRHPNEIIEIGAVKLNDNLEREGSFQEFVKPRIYKKLFSVVKRKTNITQDDISEAADFKDVLSRFKDWIGNGPYLLCTWGHDDIHHFKQNCQFYHVSAKWLKRSFDIQSHFSKIYDLPKGHRFSLERALEELAIPVGESLHRADVDAKYTAEVFIRAFDKFDLQKQMGENWLK